MKRKLHHIRAALNSTPLYRQTGIPGRPRNGIVVMYFDEAHLEACRGTFDALDPAARFCLLASSIPVEAAREKYGHGFLALPFAVNLTHRDFVICTRTLPRYKVMQMIKATTGNGRQSYFVSDFTPPDPQPDFLDRHEEAIVKVIDALADDDSVETYIARLKAIIMGEPGYQRISDYAQYWHPSVRAEVDDIVCDAGIGTHANTPIGFSKHVGDNGRVFAFEPIRSMCVQLRRELDGYDNVELVEKGLWEKDGEIEMFVAGDVSTFRDIAFVANADKETAQLTSVDSFFADRGIAPSLIKMDIEGAEQRALTGARSTIEAATPKLQICLYHSLNDFVRIPLMVREFNPDYEIFIGHHTPFFNECVLYARPPAA